MSKEVGKALALGRITLSKLREAFQPAEHNFFDDANRLRAEFSPSKLNVKTGSPTRLRSHRHGEPGKGSRRAK